MRSIRFTFIALEGLTLLIALLFSILLLVIIQNEIKERYIASHVISMGTIDIMVENFLKENTRVFNNFIVMADKERASVLLPVFSDIYYCTKELRISTIISKESNSHIFTGYDLSKSKVGSFLMKIGTGELRHSPMYRSPENDRLSVYIAARKGNEFLVGRIGMEKFRDYLMRIAEYTNSIIILATHDGYILFSTSDSLQLNLLPDKTVKELDVSGQKYLYTQKNSSVLDNHIAIFTPLSTVYIIMDSVRRSIIFFVGIIFFVIIAKIIWQSKMIIGPLGSLSAFLRSWNFSRVSEEVPKQFIAYYEISWLYNSFREKSIQITDAVNALKESEEKFRTTLSAMDDQVFVFNEEGRFILCHTPDAGDTRALAGATVGKNLSDVLPRDIIEKFEQAFDINRKGESCEFDFSLDIPGGSRWYSIKISPNNINLIYHGSIAVVRDITERKNSEQQALLDVREKDVLLKEIHHRVKNNLNVITSLLNLQSKQIQSKEEAMEAFRESRNRIFSMALVHEKLYQTKNYTQVNFREYIEIMTRELLRAYAIGNNVSVEFRIDELLLDINIAIPCGLILNELVSNALKHAFTETDSGQIIISFTVGNEKTLELAVRDNGRGLPDGFDIEAVESLGLKLVKLLTEQIGGALTIESGPGLLFRITFAG